MITAHSVIEWSVAATAVLMVVMMAVLVIWLTKGMFSD